MMNEYKYLAHHGIKGMRWGVRRFQNPDGSLTELGKKKYAGKSYRLERSAKIHEGVAAAADRARKPSALLAGGAASVAGGSFSLAYNSLGTAYITGISATPLSAILGLTAAGAVYGGYTGVKAVNQFVADRKRKKISEIDKMIAR